MSTLLSQRLARVLAALALLAFVATFLTAQLDFARRHRPGIAPEIYWKPQLLQIWLPGLVLTLLLISAAFLLPRWGRRA